MKSPVKWKGFSHIAYATNDIDKTIRFWRDLLGLKLIVCIGDQGEQQYFFEISQGQMIAFFHWENVEPVPYKRHGDPVSGEFIHDHISIGVSEMEDLWKLQNLLETADFPVSDVIDHGFLKSIYSYDPNGIPIEFSFQREDIELGKELVSNTTKVCDAAKEGCHPIEGFWPEADLFENDEEKIVVPGEGSNLFDLDHCLMILQNR